MPGFLNMGEMSALALHTMTQLANVHFADKDGRLSVVALSERLEASRHTLHKVVTRLVNAGLVDSARGPSGGIRLSQPPDRITILQVIEAVEGRITANGCLFEQRVCPSGAQCAFASLTCGMENHIREYFTKTNLVDLINENSLKGKETSCLCTNGK